MSDESDMPTEPQFVPYVASAVPAAARVLVLAPHPDDEVFGCGGSAHLHAQAGARVDVVVVTDGGGAGEQAVREAESRRACAVLGLPEPQFWGLKDRALARAPSADFATLRQRLEQCLREGSHELVYAPSPWEVHPDHRAVAAAVAEAVLARRAQGQALSWVAYEVGAPLWPTHLVDITAVRGLKRQAMEQFASQLAERDYAQHIEALNRFRSYALGRECEAVEAQWRPDEAQMRRVWEDWCADRWAHPALRAWPAQGARPWWIRWLKGR